MVFKVADGSLITLSPQAGAAAALLALTLSPSLISARSSINSLTPSMRLSYAVPALLALAGSSEVSAQNAPAGGAGVSNSSNVACGWSSSCPQTHPCCSEFGYCGRNVGILVIEIMNVENLPEDVENSGLACTAGCNPQGSFGQGFCAPTPVCQSGNYTFADTSRIQLDHSKWDGDASNYDFTLEVEDGSNTPIVQNNQLYLVLSEKGGGTKVSTTRTVLYGTIEASIKSVAQNGVVTAFITMSGVKDEIDWEFTTANTSEAQNNYYWEGDVNNYENGGTAISRNRDTTFHTFGMNWTPDRLDWTIDGKTVRTLLKSDTTNGRFPQTPSRVQFSVWPAGTSSSPKGTVDWSGGLIDWTKTGSSNYFASQVQWVSIQCYDNSALPYVQSNQTSSSNSSSKSSKRSLEYEGLFERDLWERAPVVNSYVYGTNDSNGQIGVSGSNAGTIINSPYSTGQNMLVKNGDTKGVSGGKTGTSGGLFGNSAVGNWWQKLATAAKAGIIIGICAVFLFIFVAFCTCFARRKDRRKAALRKEQGLNDSIPLVAKTGGGGGRPGAVPNQNLGSESRSQVNLPGKYARSNSDFDASSVASKGSYYRSQSPVPNVPVIPNYYAQQQNLAYQYPQQGYGSPQGAYGGGYASPQQYGGGGAPAYHQQQQYPRY
ncbi:hypothetical protein JCM5353_007882 [Sporobolomyces roseus]